MEDIGKVVEISLDELIRLRQDAFELERVRELIYRKFFSNSSSEQLLNISSGRQRIWRDLLDSYWESVEQKKKKEE